MLNQSERSQSLEKVSICDMYIYIYCIVLVRLYNHISVFETSEADLAVLGSCFHDTLCFDLTFKVSCPWHPQVEWTSHCCCCPPFWRFPAFVPCLLLGWTTKRVKMRNPTCQNCRWPNIQPCPWACRDRVLFFHEGFEKNIKKKKRHTSVYSVWSALVLHTVYLSNINFLAQLKSKTFGKSVILCLAVIRLLSRYPFFVASTMVLFVFSDLGLGTVVNIVFHAGTETTTVGPAFSFSVMTLSRDSLKGGGSRFTAAALNNSKKVFDQKKKQSLHSLIHGNCRIKRLHLLVIKLPVRPCRGLKKSRFFLFTETADTASGAWLIAVLVIGLSGVWPFAKLGMLLYAWLTPPSSLKKSRRGRILVFLDEYGKYSFLEAKTWRLAESKANKRTKNTGLPRTTIII